MPSDSDPPSVARALLLPLAGMPWDRFEAFAADLVSQLKDIRSHSCHRYGGPGHKQRGIDIFADRDDGSRWAFSNKRYETYNVGHVKKHVAETSYQADRFYILTSATAGTAVRDEVRKRPGWDIWDVDDLSRETRDLASRRPESARRLVDTHFGPHWRAAFLGLPAVAAFLTPTDYFRPLLGRHRLFHHAYDLIGREPELRQLLGWEADPEARIGMLIGRGGIGKSRLVKAFADELDGRPEARHVWLQVESVPIDQAALGELPAAPCAVIVDDAHRTEQLGLMLAHARRRPDLKVLLVTRPRGAGRIRSELARAGFDTREMREWPEVRDLAAADTRALAAAVLGQDRDDLVERLVRATGDCPLVTVIGARLLVESAVAPELLDQHEEFRRAVLARLCDDAIGQVGGPGPPDLTRRLLWTLAAVAPLNADDRGTMTAVSRFLSSDEAEVRRRFDDLEAAGVAASRGNTFRITPDVLADYLLDEACLGARRRPTGFASQAFIAIPASATKVLRNLAELDWRVREARAEGTTLLDEIWGWIEGWCRDGDYDKRADVFDLIADVAYYQPDRVLRLVSTAIHSAPVRGTGDEADGSPAQSRARMLGRIPPILRHCGYSLDHLPATLEQLWELARDPDLPSNLATDDPVRIVEVLGGFELEKDLRYSQLVAAAAARWTRSTLHPRTADLLAVIEPLFARTVEHQEPSDGGTVRISWHGIRFDQVAAVRASAIEVAEALLTGGDVPTRLRAVKTLKEALNEHAHGAISAVQEEWISEWEADQLRVIDVFDRAIASSPHQIVHLHVRDALRYQARYGRLSNVRHRASQVIAGIPDTHEYRLTRLLVPAFTHTVFGEDEDDRSEAKTNYARQQEQFRDLAGAVAAEFWRQHPSPERALSEVDRLIRELLPADGSARPATLVWNLLASRPAAAADFAELILADPSRPTAECFGFCAQYVGSTDPGRASAFRLRALDGGSEALARVIGNDLAYRPRGTPLLTGEHEVLDRLIRHPIPHVRAAGVAALQHLGDHDPRTAIALLSGVDVGDSADVAKELCGLVTHNRDSNELARALTDEDLAVLMGKLERLPGIGMDTIDFFGRVEARMPEQVADFFIRRLERERAPDRRGDFHALPFQGLRGIFATLADSTAAASVMRRVRGLALNATRSTPRRAAARLFRAVSGNYSIAGLATLGEWLDSSNPEEAAAALALLSAVPPDFVFEQVDYVRYVLERADRFGDECKRDAVDVFYYATTGAGKSGLSGRPFPRDVRNRDRASDVLRSQTPGTPLHRLYDLIRQAAEQSIAAVEKRADRNESASRSDPTVAASLVTLPVQS